MEEEKAGAAASKPEISSEEAFDEIEDDNKEAKETGSPSTDKFESSSEEAVHQIECDSDKATEIRSDKRPTSVKVQMIRAELKALSRKFLELIMVVGISGLVQTIVDMVLNLLLGKALTFLEVARLLSISISFSISIPIVFLHVIAIGDLFVLTLPLVCLLSIFGHPTGSPAIGMFVGLLSNHYVAGFLGYALAQRHTLLKDMYKIPTPDNEEVERPRVLRMVARLIHALLNLGVTLRLVWVLSNSADYTPVDLVMHCLLPLIGVLLFWITFVVVSLGDAFIGDDGLALVVFYLFFIMLNYVLMVVTLGDAVATLATWITALGLSGFLSYSIRIYNILRVTKDLGTQSQATS